ncbi:MAG: chromosome segregation protein SMC [Saccharofermentanales bacterium]
MYLKTLEIQGFKSFPEKTVIEFHQGITAIVGPNGSGKSNITDAIRWVLGEQSVKTLRGSKMEDIIFTGTQSRRAMGFAEVAMVIDNADGKIPVEYTEISVARRLYRSGESEYLINKTPCRLKDVLTLFMDTGLGRDGYSIVGQGKVDEILSHKSEDRRKVFEEASGIVKFKSRKDEAERKLENTRQNLIRINDIIAELEVQIGPLEQQSKVAKQYLLHRDELKGVEIALFLDNIAKFTLKLDEYNEEYNAILKEINIQTVGLEDMKLQNRNLTDQSSAVEKDIEDKKGYLQSLTGQIRDFQTKIDINSDRIAQIRQKLKDNSDEGGSIDEALQQLADELATRKQKEEYLRRQLGQYNAKLTSYEDEMVGIIETLNESGKNAERIKLRIDELTESLYDKRMQSRQTRGQIKMIEQREKNVASDIVNLISEQDSLTIQKEECEELHLAVVSAEQKARTNLEELRKKLEESKNTCTQLAVQAESRKMDAENINYRIRTLTELEKAREGYSDAVKSILTLCGSDSSYKDRIRGTIGDLIETDRRCETAIEIALGGSVQNIVTDNEGTASSLIDYLKTNRLGRATFLPISSIQGRPAERSVIAEAQKAEGYVGFANDLVKFPAEIRGIIDSLLGRIIVIDNLDHAIRLARRISYSTRIVTLEGDVVNPGGALTGGYQKGKGTGIIGRAREIERLTEEVQTIRKEAADLAARLPEAEEVLKATAREAFAAEQLLNNKGHERIREESRLAQISQDLTRCKGRIGMFRAEQEQIDKQKTDIDSEADALDGEALLSEKEIAKLKEELENVQTASKEETQNRDDLRETISDLKLSVNSIEESLASAEEITERINKEREQYENTAKKRQADIVRSGSELQELEESNVIIKADIDGLALLREAADAQILSLTEKRSALEEKMAGFYDRFESITSKTGELQSDLAKSEVKRGRMEAALDEAKNKLWEQYELTYENAAKWSSEIESPVIAQRKVNELRRLIKELGNINIGAIEEYDKVSERYKFLTVQRDDIENSRNKLMGVITEITNEMKKQFVEHFRIINENFKAVFSELFGGGMAEIILGDEEDVLNCNIDIHAQPPGKKLQNMLLLSGGERCLTAIALLFAILKLKPSPFCVLDEIEAALDDANIVRFSEYVRNYTAESQFILVTHRKGTMEAADMLYGVTMQERGISKILSMKLSD